MASGTPKSWHSDAEWRQHIDFISKLYINDRLSWDQIAGRLSVSGFITSGRAVKNKCGDWKIQRYTHEHECLILARYWLYHHERGQTLKFKRWGEDFPQDEIGDYIKTHPNIEASNDSLPEYLTVTGPNTYSIADVETDLPSSEPPTLSGESHITANTFERQQDDAEHTRKRKRIAIRSPTSKKADDGDAVRRENGSDEKAMDHRATIGSGDKGHDKEDEDDDCDESDRVKNEVQKALEILTQLTPKDGKDARAVRRVKELVTDAIKDEEEEQKQQKEKTDLGPLHWAASSNNKRIAASLLKHGADINARGGRGWTPLHLAAARGCFDVLSFLLLQEDIDIDAVDDEGGSALLIATAAESLDCALLLIKRGANVDVGCRRTATALHLACMADGMDKVVEAIAEKTEKLDNQTAKGLTALHYALSHSNEEVVYTLLKHGANMNIPDEDGRTAMHQACFEGSSKLLFRMLQENVDLSATANRDETVLHILCQRGLCDVARAVVDREGVDINARCRAGMTPLIVATLNGHFETVRMLVEKQADLTAADEDMDTALTLAIRHKKEEIAAYLIEKKSPVNPQNHSVWRWKAKLEHNRRARAAFSVPALPLSSAKAQRQQTLSASSSSRISRSNLQNQVMQSVLPEVMRCMQQAFDAAIPNVNHPGSPMTGMRSSNCKPMSGVAMGNNPTANNSLNFSSGPYQSLNTGINFDEYLADANIWDFDPNLPMDGIMENAGM